MRRSNIITNKVIILVILSGLFNLSSYVFDQMVIQSELKNRDLERRMVSNRVALETLSYEINTLNDLSFDIFKSSHYFFKHLPLNMHGAMSFLGKTPDSKFTWEKTFSKEVTEKIGKDFLKKYNELILDFNKKTDEMHKIFSVILPDSKTVFSIKDLKIDPNILDTYNPSWSTDEIEQDKRDEENYKIYKEIHAKITKFESFEFHTQYYLAKSENNYIDQFSNFFDFVDEYAKQQNKINYYILFSIIAQILGILFILFLFKTILNNKIKPNA